MCSISSSSIAYSSSVTVLDTNSGLGLPWLCVFQFLILFIRSSKDISDTKSKLLSYSNDSCVNESLNKPLTLLKSFSKNLSYGSTGIGVSVSIYTALSLNVLHVGSI